MEKIDYKNVLGECYKAKLGQPRTIVVPKLNYLMVEGKGDPNTSKEYAAAVEALYSVSYTLKFIVKREHSRDYGVMPLEGLWWMEDMTQFTAEDKKNWLWRAMILQPDFVTREMVEKAIEQVVAKKGQDSVSGLMFDSYNEGRVAQVLYVGPYSDEGPTIRELHIYIESQGGKLSGATKHHHEIYLSDPRRAAPEALKTIIRQPY